MAASTKQTKAIAAANAAISIAQAIAALRATINEYIVAYNSEGYSTVWNNLPTAAQNTDGTLGTADGTPNVAHPINTGIITTLAKAVSATQLINSVAMFEQLQNFFTNAAVTTNNYNITIDDLAN